MGTNSRESAYVQCTQNITEWLSYSWKSEEIYELFSKPSVGNRRLAGKIRPVMASNPTRYVQNFK